MNLGLSKNQIKLVRSLRQKKLRQQEGLFVVEGIKGISEFLDSDYKLHLLFTTQRLFEASKEVTIEISEAELKKISSLKNPNTALAIFRIPQSKPIQNNGLIVVLDDLRDPGNLGTIIRLSDWYNVQNLVCSLNTVDCYNPKVVQATMGSLTRVNIQYTDLKPYLEASKATIFGTFLEGENIYITDLPQEGIIVLGNEANGISKTIEALVTRKVTIPQFGASKDTESLNVANATAVVLSEFRRRTIEM